MAAVIIGSLPEKAQPGEKFRLDLTRSFVHPGDNSIQTMTATIDGEVFNIVQNKIVDYAFDTTGEKTIAVYAECGGSGHPSTSKNFTITVVAASSENLFSDDNDIVGLEPDILNYLPEGRAQYLYVAREAQDRILTSLDERGITDTDGNRLTAASVVDTEEVNDWSKYLVLQFIFESLSNAIDDIFHEKALRYRDMVNQAKNRAFLRLDYDGDGTVATTERGSATTGRIVRR